MKAQKLPSGNWRIRVYSHTDKNGKKIYKSFTHKDKDKVKKLAHAFLAERDFDTEPELTVEQAIEEYIDSKENVLSPSTVRSYRAMQKKNYESINKIYVSRITSKDLQYFVSELNRDHSAKSVKNIYGLLISSISMHSDKKYRVTLPQREVIEYATPDDSEVKLLLDNADGDLKKAIILASIGTLRRSEICALKYDDILPQMSAVYVHASIIMNSDKKWQYKPVPKNNSSVRRVPLPKQVIYSLGEGDPDEFVVKLNPGQLTNRFRRLRNRLGLSCRFHDLRHYAASIRMYMGIPIKEIQAVGGWNTPDTLQKIYINQLKSKTSEYTKRANQYFEDNLLNEKENVK